MNPVIALRRAVLLALLCAPSTALAQRWHGAAAAGTDRWITPEFSGQGFLIFDLRGEGVVAGGDVHLQYNTETLQVGIERLPLAGGRAELAFGARAEGALAGVLRNYFRAGYRDTERGFFASYAMGFASIKWLVGGAHSLELFVAGRRWFFGTEAGVTAPSLVLPPDTWAVEPRLRYTFWQLETPEGEWSGSVLFPRVTGVAFGVELGTDVRSDARAWGSINGRSDGRNNPASAILMARQWLRLGSSLSRVVRVQIEQNASWGVGEDDLTRPRIGGMSPYVIPVPGLPWPALLSERFVAAQASVHLRTTATSPHEFGVAVAGGTFNDVARVGALDTFGAAGGVGVFTDLRHKSLVLHVRGGYAFPASWQRDPPNFSALAMVGLRLF